MAVASAERTSSSPAQKEPHNQYCSRKPKWWTQLSGRRGTRGQRQAIQRMTHRGYCLSKDVLTNFSRVNNRARQENAINGQRRVQRSERLSATECDYDYNYDEWRRAWWNGALGLTIANDETDAGSTCSITNASIIHTAPPNVMSIGKCNTKYAHKIQQMYDYKSPLSPKEYKRVWLEIGFGNGDNLLANAKNHPEDLFVGCEIHQPGVGTVLRQMEMGMGLPDDAADCQKGRLIQIDDENNKDDEDTSDGEINGTLVSLDDKSTSPNSSSSMQEPQHLSSRFNIRILPGDGIKLLSHLPTNYLDFLLITFPDPWPRDCHVHWRVVQREVVREIHRVLKPLGKVYVATDAKCFDEWTREIFRQESSSPCDVMDGDVSGDGITTPLWNEITPCPDRASWLPVVSYYEQKGLDEGRCTILQCWQRGQMNAGGDPLYARVSGPTAPLPMAFAIHPQTTSIKPADAAKSATVQANATSSPQPV